MGADYEQDDVFSGTVPYTRPVTGMGWADDIRLDLGYEGAGDGAQNQEWVDEVIAYGTVGPDKPVFMAEPFLQAMTGDHAADGYVGLSHAHEPTLEQAQLASYRTLYLTFGFEGVNDPVTNTLAHVDSRDYLMQKLLTYLMSDPTATLPDQTVTAGDTVTLATTAGFVGTTPLTATIVGYRWDFGDSSAFESTTAPSVSHVYDADGTYTARVEVTDDYGHKYVAQATITVEPSGYTIYLPLVTKNF
jgi:hypothetical protein